MNFSQFRKQWGFYIAHSYRDLRRNGWRTAFALFCIATGVAAVVALRSLALMIGDELTLNLAEINRGDIQIVASDDLSPRYYTRSIQGEAVFTDDGMTALRQWATQEGVEIQFASNLNVTTILPIQDDGEFGKPFTLIPILIEPDKWAFYNEIFVNEPQLIPIRDAFPAGQRGLIMSKRVALEHGLEIGDQVYAGGNEVPMTVAGFVDDETEGSLVLRNGAAGFIGFVYYPLDHAADLNLEPHPERAFIKIPLGRAVKDIDDSLERRFGEGISRITTDELAEQNQETADLVNDLILVMGLSSILIGGMGIVNTMNVIVGRRTLEIAVLKTLGLKAWRVTTLFLVEAALMGILGSLIGVLAGIVLSYFVRGVGEEVLQTSLSWRAYPEAWYSGATLGFVITVTFGFLPTLNAGQVRPAGVLRPNEIELPNAGLKRTLGALIVVIVAFGLTLNTIVQGQIELPIELMLGLGGFIIGLFGGVMLANEGLVDPVTDDNAEVAANHSVRIMTGTIAAIALLILGVLNLFLNVPISLALLYGIPLFIGGVSYLALRRFSDLGIARLSRQILLLLGSLILGGMVGGGLFTLITAILKILYPHDSPLPGLPQAAIVSFIIGFLTLIGFRRRGRQAAGTVGMALIGAAVLAIIGFSIGDVLNSILGKTAFWDTLESWSVGVIVVEIIALALGGTFAVILGLVWLVGKTPNFGNVDVKLAMRNINARKTRTASTMIGLIVGVGALSLITLTTSGVTSLLENQLETDVGGNVIIISRDPNTGEAVRKRLDSTLEGVESYTQFTAYRGRIVRVNGEEPDIDNFQIGDAADGNTREIGTSDTEPGIGFAFTAVDPTRNPPDYEMKSGRFFTANDVGKPVMVLREPFRGTLFYQLGVTQGSTITWLLKPPPDSGEEPFELTFTVIGIIDRDSEQAGVADSLVAPIDSVPESVRPDSIVTIANIKDENVDAAMVEFARIPNAFALEIGFIVQLAQRLLDQLIAIPALVAILALVAGIAIIANTVALDTQERRRQIGVMKAIGLKGYRVLGQLMFENAYTGLVAGLVGVGIGLIATILVGVLGSSDEIGQTLKLMPALRLVFMAIVVSLGATLFAAWSAARESPLEVLRYE